MACNCGKTSASANGYKVITPDGEVQMVADLNAARVIRAASGPTTKILQATAADAAKYRDGAVP